tara:strand:- start:694 stop:1668 length:975 start_codon:yes stop_codon:yes gene_type:complete
MKSINTILIIFSLFVTTFFYAQNKNTSSDNAQNIMISTFVSDQIEEMNEASRNFLENKLKQIISKNGVTSSKINGRFIITPNVNIISKEITATAPPMHAYDLEISFFIGDGIDGKLFSSFSMNYKGVGQSETKAYRAALKSINTSNARFEKFISESKEKIIEFYNSQCEFILKEAKLLEQQNKFSAALLKLTSIPSACQNCFEKSSKEASLIYQKYLDRECDIYMNKAKAIWASSQDEKGAREAAELLSLVDPDAKCANDAKSMLEKIYKELKSRILDLDEREWNYKLKEQMQESERIEAMRQIGIAFGENQPQNVTYNYRGWF